MHVFLYNKVAKYLSLLLKKSIQILFNWTFKKMITKLIRYFEIFVISAFIWFEDTSESGGVYRKLKFGKSSDWWAS